MADVFDIDWATDEPIVWPTRKQMHVEMGQGVAMNLVVELHRSIELIDGLCYGHGFLPKGHSVIGQIEGLDNVDLRDDAYVAEDGDFGIGGDPGLVQVGDDAVRAP